MKFTVNKMQGIAALIVMMFFTCSIYAEEKNRFSPYIAVQSNAEYISKSADMGAHNDKEKDFNFVLTDAVMGVNFQEEKLTGTFELVLADDNLAEIGLAFAEYDTGTVKFMTGLNDTPYTFLSRESAFEGNNFVGFGTTTEDIAIMQIRGDINGFFISIISPNLPTDDNGDYSINNQVFDDFEAVMPKTCIGYRYESNTAGFSFGGAMNMFRINDNTGLLDNEQIASYLFFVNGSIKKGIFECNANLGYSINPAEFGLEQSVASDAVIDGKTIEDTATLEGFFEAGVDMNRFAIYAGVGYIQADNKKNEKVDRAMAYFFQIPVKLNEYYTLTPEVSYHDYMKDASGSDEGNEMSIGLSVEMVFE